MTKLDIEAISQAMLRFRRAKDKAERDHDAKKFEFFAAVTELCEQEPRATRMIMVPNDVGPTDEQIEAWVREQFPEWRVLTIEDEPVRVLVEQDPAWMKYGYLSKDHKTYFQRNVIQGSPDLDDVSLKEDDIALWYRITRCPIEDIVRAFAQEAASSIGGEVIGEMQLYIERHIEEWPRMIRPFDQLEEEDFDAVQRYIIPGKLSYRFEKPRKPRQDELE